MNKKTILAFVILSIATKLTNAQQGRIGINTSNPQGVLHIDGAKDNPNTGSPNASQQANDVIITSTGNVGIGTTNPTRKLEIVSETSPSLRINDGSQQQGYYLVSDSNGNGSWKSLTKTIMANFPTNGYNGTISSTGYTGVSITLPPGKWLVLTNIVLVATTNPNATSNAWVRLQWGKDQIPNSPASGSDYSIEGRLNSGVFVAPKGVASGSTIINNNSTNDRTFYLNLSGTDTFGSYSANWDNLGSSDWDENSIIAYPAN